MRTLLDRFPVPDGTPLVRHIKLLERANLLYGDGALLNQEHLVYTEALVAAAARLYDSGPEYNFSVEELGSVKALATLLMDDMPPDADVLSRRINETMGNHPADPVAKLQVRILTAVAAQVAPQPGESGVESLRRGIAANMTTPETVVAFQNSGVTLPGMGRAAAMPSAMDPAPASGPFDGDVVVGANAARPTPDHSGNPGQDGNPRQFLRFWRHLMSEVRR